MARKWTTKEEEVRKKELVQLYVKQNKTISEIGEILELAENTIYDRLVRLGIGSVRSKKQKFNNQNFKIKIPKKMSADLAEFIGIMLGDGHLTPTQITVTLGTKESQYVEYVVDLMLRLFGVKPKITSSLDNCQTVYLGSVILVKWLLKNFGLVYNKVKYQVDIPKQCFFNANFIKRTLKGLIDTDGSIYLIRRGLQISFTNKSKPLLKSVQIMLKKSGFHPSNLSSNKVYLTRKDDVSNYIKKIGFANDRHNARVKQFIKILGGSYSGNYT